MPALLTKISTAAEFLDYLLGDAFALIFFALRRRHSRDGHVSDAGGDPLRLLSFKVQEGDGRPMFRKDLRRCQADTLLLSPRLEIPRLDLVVTSSFPSFSISCC